MFCKYETLIYVVVCVGVCIVYISLRPTQALDEYVRSW